MKFLEAQEIIKKELQLFRDEFNAKTDFSRDYRCHDYYVLSAMNDSFNLAETEENLNLLYNKPNGYKYNHIYQYRLLQRYKELMGADFPKLWR